MQLNTTKLLCGLLFCLFFSACVTVGPDYHPPEVKLPERFVSASARENAKTVDDAAKWWEVLNDKELNSLIERAILSNPDLEVALTRLQMAQTQEAVVMGLALPQGDFSGGAARGSGTNVTKGRIAGPINAGTDTQGLQQLTQVFGFSAGWELDLFGKFRREAEAARYDRETAAAIRNDVLIAVTAKTREPIGRMGPWAERL